VKKKKEEPKTKKEINYKVILYSLVALIFLYFSFTIDWLFIIGAVILMILNQKELFKNKNK
jgi:hypothetical protein